MNRVRRSLLKGALAAGAGSGVLRAPWASSSEPARAPPIPLIDVHSHIAPPKWVAELVTRKLNHAPNVSPELIDGWSPAMQIEEMDRAGVVKAINSVTMPGVWFDDRDAAYRLARECNEYAARLRDDSRGRLGTFAILPMPDVDGSLREISYALDTLKADGVHLFTSFGDVWLGDPKFDPVFQELDRRGALIHVHPTAPNCCRNLVPGILYPVIELGTDTTRAIARFVFTGSSQRYTRLRMIFSHAGGTMPYLTERFNYLARQPAYKQVLPGGFDPEARRFYYDTAQGMSSAAMLGLKAVAPVSHILFGTDYPVRTQLETIQALSACGAFTAQELKDIGSRNYAELATRSHA